MKDSKMLGKNFKISGFSYGLIGDLVMGLPMLKYFEKKYPDSYKIWIIQKKCSMCAPLYFNHPLIDRIKITDGWNDLGPLDNALRESCDLNMKYKGWKHSSTYWYNNYNCVDETARLIGINDLTEVLTEEELIPELIPWFNIGFRNTKFDTYSKKYESDLGIFHNNIAIWPFATLAKDSGRSPSLKWWRDTVNALLDSNYSVYHFGRPDEPKIVDREGYENFTNLSYMENVQISLASRLAIGTDSGSMWVMGAYSHPSIHLMTNWLPNHTKNILSLAPINKNGTNIFAGGSTSNIKIEKVINTVKEKVPL